MRTCHSLGLCVATLSVVLSFPAASPAQTPAGAMAQKYGIAVVDISYVFKNHQRFNGMMEQMKTDVQAAEKSLREERNAIAQKEELLNSGTYQPGSPDYKRLDEEVTRLKSDWNLKATKQRKEFLEKEAKIYYQAYLEVNDAVQYFAQRTNLGLVLRFNGDPIDPNKREDVLRAINKPVVFQNGIDITPDILKAVNRSPATGPAPGTATRPQVPGRPVVPR